MAGKLAKISINYHNSEDHFSTTTATTTTTTTATITEAIPTGSHIIPLGRNTITRGIHA